MGAKSAIGANSGGCGPRSACARYLLFRPANGFDFPRREHSRPMFVPATTRTFRNQPGPKVLLINQLFFMPYS